jgi:hypothetical protein
MGNIVERLISAGLEVRYFFSCQRDEIYVKVRAETKRLKTEASRIDYRLQLDPQRLAAKCQLGKKRQGEFIWKPITIVDEFKVFLFFSLFFESFLRLKNIKTPR